MTFSPFLDAAPIIQLHAGSATLALVLAATMMLSPKGRRVHLWLGRSCVALVIVAAITALFITQDNHPHWSWIHWTVPLTAAFLGVLLLGLRWRKRRLHQVGGWLLFIGALVIPFIVAAAIPGRVLNQMLTGA